MDLQDIPLFAMLKNRMGYLAQRQRVIAENVANANTPGYTPHDLKPFSFAAQVQAAGGTAGVAGASAASGMAVTQPGHMLPPGTSGSSGSQFQPADAKDSETTLDGNSVVLEEEMLKMSQTRMDYDAAVSFYEKAMSMLQMAVKAPGQG